MAAAEKLPGAPGPVLLRCEWRNRSLVIDGLQERQNSSCIALVEVPDNPEATKAALTWAETEGGPFADDQIGVFDGHPVFLKATYIVVPAGAAAVAQVGWICSQGSDSPPGEPQADRAPCQVQRVSDGIYPGNGVYPHDDLIEPDG